MGACFGQPVVIPVATLAPEPKKEEVGEFLAIVADEIRLEERVQQTLHALNSI